MVLCNINEKSGIVFLISSFHYSAFRSFLPLISQLIFLFLLLQQWLARHFNDVEARRLVLFMVTGAAFMLLREQRIDSEEFLERQR